MISEIKKVGIIGAGQMGNGIAHVCSLSNYDVVLNDLSADNLDKGMATIKKNMDRQVSKGAISAEERDKAMSRIVPATDLKAMAEMDLVIEAATEHEETKRKIFAAVTPVLRPDAMIASNTSSISITRLAASTDRAEQFIGIHFMNPVPVMKLIELVRGIATDEQTYITSKKFADSLGKTVAVSEDFPRFHGQPHPVANDQRSHLHPL